MPGLDGLATTRLLRQEGPKTRVILVTAYLSPDYILEALKVGVAAYILKEAGPPELLDAIRRVLRGETLLNRDVATALLSRLTGSQPHTADLATRRLTPRELELLQLFATTRLTLRELEVLQLLAEGYTHGEIASQLNLSTGTVGIHVAHIVGKLQATGHTQTTIRAMHLGLLEDEAE
jgi:DNA-binding NarL/FixJ family response regulator